MAEKDGAKIILANDPDADRLAVAEKQERYGNKETIYIFNLKARLIWGILVTCVAKEDGIVTVVVFGLKPHRNVRELYEADHSGGSK